MAAPSLEPDDPLADLEERIRRAVDLVARFRSEKEAAEREREAAGGEVALLRGQVARLTKEVETLRAERGTVRARLEKLLDQLDAIGAG